MPVVVDRTTFLASTPGSSFGSAPTTLVDQVLLEAGRRVNSTVFASADLAIDYVCLKAAVLLSRHPKAEKMRLVSPDQVFTWEYELEQLANSVTMGLRAFVGLLGALSVAHSVLHLV